MRWFSVWVGLIGARIVGERVCGSMWVLLHVEDIVMKKRRVWRWFLPPNTVIGGEWKLRNALVFEYGRNGKGWVAWSEEWSLFGLGDTAAEAVEDLGIAMCSYVDCMADGALGGSVSCLWALENASRWLDPVDK